MKKSYVILLVVAWCVASGPVLAQENETALFEKAKVLLFDRQWDDALTVLDRFIRRYPDSDRFPLALLYRSRCLEEKRLFLRALESYRKFLNKSPNDNLREDALIAIIDIHNSLYQGGRRSSIDAVIEYLGHRQWTVRYYAAFKLSYLQDKKIAVRAVPVLKKIISEERDTELKDRAKIALMRIDPEYLKDISRLGGPEAKLLHIEVYDKKMGKTTFSIAIPFMFARLALESIPQKEKSTLKNKGYNIDTLLKKLLEKGELFRIDDQNTVFKIWIE